MFASKYRAGKTAPGTKPQETVSFPRAGYQQFTAPVEPEETTSLPSQVTEVMSVVRLNWDFMSTSEFNPTPYALSLLDSSALGREYDSFLDVYDKLEKAMDIIVNEYHEAFNVSIQRFSSVVDSISDSQRRVLEMKESLEQSKQWLESKRFDVLHLWVKSIQFKEMSRILDTIDELQKTPAKLEALIQSKFYLTAVRLLTSSIKTITSPDFSEIGALETIHAKLLAIRSNLHETLIDELQNHIYLKVSFASVGNNFNDSWKIEDSYFSQQRIQQIKSLIKPDIVEDFDTNPEVNSFQFMQAIAEALQLLDKLPEASKILKERIAIETYYVVERVIQETDQWFAKTTVEVVSSGQDSWGMQESLNDSSEVLRYLLADLYKRFEKIVERSMFVDLVMKSYSKSIKSSDGYTLSDVCLCIQNEVKTLLCDYLTSSDRSVAMNTKISLNDVLKEGKQGAKMGPSKQIFQIGGSSAADQLERVYKDMDSPLSPNASPARFMLEDPAMDGFGPAGGRIIDRYASVVATGHRLLITPHPSNILISFKPTINFMDQMETATNVKASPFHTFMKDFILTVFLPQMQDQISNYFHDHVNGIDAFQTEKCTGIPYPLIKSAVAMVVLTYGMAKTVTHIPIHREDFLEVVKSSLVRFYEKCLFRFKALTSSDQILDENSIENIPSAKPVISAMWVKEPEIVTLLQENTCLSEDDDEVNLDFNQLLSLKETAVEMKLKGERSFHRSELLFEHRKLISFAHLHCGLQWMVTQIRQLKRHTNLDIASEPKMKKRVSEESLTDLMRWSTESLPALVVDSQEETYLTLSPEMSKAFDKILDDFTSLSNTCLFLIRLELRCHSMFYLDLALREGTYFYEEENYDPDPYIVSLNNDLTAIEEAISQSLPAKRTRFLFDGLAPLMTLILTMNLRRIRRVNENGVYKLVHNVQSLQQNLTNLASVHEKGLDRARNYFLLLLQDGNGLVHYVEKNPGKFTYDEYRVVLEHIFAQGIEEEGYQHKPFAETLQKLKDYFVQHKA